MRIKTLRQLPRISGGLRTRPIEDAPDKLATAGNAIELPMSRQDIADYLCLTIETVSRTLTSLETAATIDVPTSRRIVLRNRGALNRLNG